MRASDITLSKVPSDYSVRVLYLLIFQYPLDTLVWAWNHHTATWMFGLDALYWKALSRTDWPEEGVDRMDSVWFHFTPLLNVALDK